MADSTATPTPRTAKTSPPTAERTVGNAPWRLWAWPYGLVVPALLLLWYVVPAGWLWVPVALAAGFLVSLRTRSDADPRGQGGGAG